MTSPMNTATRVADDLTVPSIRIRQMNRGQINSAGDCVLYWMIANRRTHWNFALQRAVEWAVELRKPLLILEALRSDYPWASDRFHRFVLDGMADNAKSLSGSGAGYYPYVEMAPGDGRGLLETLAENACIVVTDDLPAFFLPRAVSTAGDRLPIPLEQVDSNGLLPMAEADKAFSTAYSFRRILQKKLPDFLDQMPLPDPAASLSSSRLSQLPPDVVERWPPASEELLSGTRDNLGAIAINHKVQPIRMRGGAVAATVLARRFIEDNLPSYGEGRIDPAEDTTSGLSPYLHFGHISVHQVFAELVHVRGWSIDRLGPIPSGRRSGWWGLDAPAEAFLDQLVTWRELGFNFCHNRRDYDQFESLPDWAQETLAEHASDPRPYLYSSEELESARTHDDLWNAAQHQLVVEGRIHTYLRMLWGKKILEWTASPRDALRVMINFNNQYAVDGRDPNSYSGIFWCLGRYDRPWGPERPIFGKVRYMSSENTKRKLAVTRYIEKYS